MDHVSAGEARQVAAIVRQREGTASATQCIQDAQFLFWHAYTWPENCPDEVDPPTEGNAEE
jgi:hypothetical protein